jgi:hypothetical protein
MNTDQSTSSKGALMDQKKLVGLLLAQDNARPRSQQKAIGVSSLGDCRRKVWHMSQGHEGTNPTLRLASMLGTAIHAMIESAVAEDGVLIEHRVENPGLPPATIDYFDTRTGEIVDWKTIKLSGVDYFVTKQKRWQVQTYGYLMSLAGYEVKTVTLVGIPRDGSENNIIVHSEPYDEQIALEALAWLKEVEAQTEPPAPERDPVSFCSSYCAFYGSLCAGKAPDFSGTPIVDDNATKAASRYIEINTTIKQLEAEKDAVKTALEGVSGITIDGIKVSWSEIAGRKSPDTEEILRLLQTHVDESMELPMKSGSASVRLNVK